MSSHEYVEEVSSLQNLLLHHGVPYTHGDLELRYLHPDQQQLWTSVEHVIEEVLLIKQRPWDEIDQWSRQLLALETHNPHDLVTDNFFREMLHLAQWPNLHINLNSPLPMPLYTVLRDILHQIKEVFFRCFASLTLEYHALHLEILAKPRAVVFQWLDKSEEELKRQYQVVAQAGLDLQEAARDLLPEYRQYITVYETLQDTPYGVAAPKLAQKLRHWSREIPVLILYIAQPTGTTTQEQLHALRETERNLTTIADMRPGTVGQMLSGELNSRFSNCQRIRRAVHENAQIPLLWNCVKEQVRKELDISERQGSWRNSVFKATIQQIRAAEQLNTIVEDALIVANIVGLVLLTLPEGGIGFIPGYALAMSQITLGVIDTVVAFGMANEAWSSQFREEAARQTTINPDTRLASDTAPNRHDATTKTVVAAGTIAIAAAGPALRLLRKSARARTLEGTIKPKAAEIDPGIETAPQTPLAPTPTEPVVPPSPEVQTTPPEPAPPPPPEIQPTPTEPVVSPPKTQPSAPEPTSSTLPEVEPAPVGELSPPSSHSLRSSKKILIARRMQVYKRIRTLERQCGQIPGSQEAHAKLQTARNLLDRAGTQTEEELTSIIDDANLYANMAEQDLLQATKLATPQQLQAGRRAFAEKLVKEKRELGITDYDQCGLDTPGLSDEEWLARYDAQTQSIEAIRHLPNDFYSILVKSDTGDRANAARRIGKSWTYIRREAEKHGAYNPQISLKERERVWEDAYLSYLKEQSKRS